MSTYARLLDPWLLGAYSRVRGRRYGAHRRLLERSQWWPRERVQEFQWRELQRLLEHCFARVPYYQQKYAGSSAGDIRSWDDFRRLPPLDRTEVNEHREELRDPGSRQRLILHATGGSSGTPTRFYMNQDSFDWRMAATARAYAWSGYRLGERALFLWGAPATLPSRSAAAKLAAFHWVRGEKIFNTFHQDERLWAEVLSWARRAKPKVLVGYVSSLEEFARYLLARGLQLEGMRAALAAAEPVSEASRELVQAAFGAPLFNTYGSREFMSIAAECNHRQGLHINAENLLVEVEGSGSGAGELLITDLHNYGTPLVRYRIGDLGELGSEACPCGRGLPLLRAVEGRAVDVMRLAGGHVVSGIVFRHILKEFPLIREFQAEQRTRDSVLLRLVANEPLAAGELERIRAGMVRLVGFDIRIEIEEVGSIPRLASGKRRSVIGLPA